jgi:spermidine synthase
MQFSPRGGRAILYSLIFASGAAGLIYQVAWHKYLAILLGAQARATAVVLGIFLGGISLGYWCFGKWTRWKRWNLLLVYCLVEVALGFWGFCFPYLFKGAMAVVPKMYATFGLTNIVTDIVLSTLLIGLPTFLMGGTLPLLTQGLSENLNEASKTHARIYGFNTVGACLGCLIAGYVLVPQTDLPFTVTLAGLINVTVGLVCYFCFAKWSQVQEVAPPAASEKAAAFTPAQLNLLVVGFFSGFYLISLETVFIRLMSLSTGASNYNFTLVVALFIFGLGVGSLIVKDIGKYTVSRLFWNQIWVSVGLLAIYFSGDYWSYWVHLLRASLRDIPQNFYFFQFLLGTGFFALLAFPIGLCGLTLPLCFHLMKDTKEGLGERVGQLYGLNTVGSVLGAIIGGYFILDFIDLPQLFKLCVLMASVTAVTTGMLYVSVMKPSRFSLVASGAIGALTLVGTLIAPDYAKDRWVQPFRHPAPTEATYKGARAFGNYLSRNTEIIQWDDGPNTSLGVGRSVYQGKEVSRTVFVNAKSDGNTRGDYFTTVLLAHLPALFAQSPKEACVIGFGTGITIGTLTLYPEIQNINVVEISNTIINNRHYYDAYNHEVSRNPKVHINEMDAFRYLGGTQKKFDLVISEPSNPWVSGIENLYSLEFYKTARAKLNPKGVFTQWIHTYSFNDQLLQMVMHTMGEVFPYLSVYQLKGGDLALVATVEPITREDLVRAAQRMGSSPALKKDLDTAGIDRLETLLALEMVPWPIAKVFGASGDIHRLESPRLSNGAARAFFIGESANLQATRRQFKEFFPAIDASLLAVYLGDKAPSWETVESFKRAFCENEQSKIRYLCEETMVLAKYLQPKYDPNSIMRGILPDRELASLNEFHEGPVKKFTVDSLQEVNSLFNVYKKYASPIARLPVAQLSTNVDYCLRTTALTEELYGECLLQKILILETAQLPGPSLNSSIQQYLEWFPTLNKGSSNYGKLQEAKNILSKMVSLRP